MPSLLGNDAIKDTANADHFDVSGMNSSPRSVSLTSLVTAAMKESKLLMAGDTNHFNGDINALAQSPTMLSAAKKGGATHIALEVDQGLQHAADKYMNNQIGRPDLEKFIDRMYQGAQNNEDGAFTRLVMNTVDFAKNNDMKVVFADPHNGWGNKPSDLSPEDDAKWELENSRDRFRDTQLVNKLNNILESDKDAKVYMAYGDAHFSVDNGNKDSIDGPMTKISLYSTRADLENFEKDMQDPKAFGRQMGWMGVKPDLVYFIDTQTFSTTTETSDAVRKAVNDLTTKPATLLKQGFTSSTTEYDLDSKKGALTSETAFNRAASAAIPLQDQDIEINNPTLKQKVASNATSYLSTANSLA